MDKKVNPVDCNEKTGADALPLDRMSTPASFSGELLGFNHFCGIHRFTVFHHFEVNVDPLARLQLANTG
jgi:hypothetical protein